MGEALAPLKKEAAAPPRWLVRAEEGMRVVGRFLGSLWIPLLSRGCRLSAVEDLRADWHRPLLNSQVLLE